MANFADPIEPNQDLGGAVSFPIAYAVEEAGQTFLYGVPVQIDNGTDGGVAIWDGATLATPGGIAGIASQNANNLGTTGAGAPIGFSPILGPGSVIGNYAANGNQPLAVITPPMTPMVDGFAYFFVAGSPTVFIGKVGTSATVTPTATLATMVGKQFGLTKDTGNPYWYVDINKTSAVAVTIVGISPIDPLGTVGGHVLFTFLPSASQIFA